LTAPPAAAIPILQDMAAESRPAAWALIRLGARAESAIIEILTEPTFRSSGPGHVIREYYARGTFDGMTWPAESTADV